MPPSSSHRSAYQPSSYYPRSSSSMLSAPRISSSYHSSYTPSYDGYPKFDRPSTTLNSTTRSSSYRYPTTAVSPAVTNTKSYLGSQTYSHHRSTTSNFSTSSTYSGLSRFSLTKDDYIKDDYDTSKRAESYRSISGSIVTSKQGRDQLNSSPFEDQSVSSWSVSPRSGASGSVPSTATSGFASACSTVATSANSSRRGSITLAGSRLAADVSLSCGSSNSDRDLSDTDLPNAGFNNLGNTCYMNAILQCLVRTRPLLQLALTATVDTQDSSTSSLDERPKRSLFIAFAKLVQRIARSNTSASSLSSRSLTLLSTNTISPLDFKREFENVTPRFRGYGQQDAHEFMCYLIDALHNELTVQQKTTEQTAATATIDYSPSTFVGELRSALRCQTCLHESVTVDTFMHLSVSLSDDNDNSLSSCAADFIESGSGSLTIERCIEQFMREEVLEGAEAAMCEHCRERRQSTKRFSIRKFPQILIIHLKRFSGERYKCKNNALVDFPLDGLQLTKFASVEEKVPNYDLFAVVNHSGSLEFGHYTACVRRRSFNSASHNDSGSAFSTSEWTCFDDSRVTEVAAKKVVSPEAYLLFYEMRKSNAKRDSAC